VFALPACDDDDDSDTQGSASDGESSDSGGSDGSGGSTGGSSDGSGGSSDGSGGSSDGSGGSGGSTGGSSDGSGGSTTDDSGGLKEVGQPCQYADECQGDVCLFTGGDDVGLCSQVCDDWSDCPDFWDCVEVDNTAFKACFPGD
ncbi:MAG: hypothetical protein KC486_21765, partial [Myxococcales bacterium]|nr:hypothetical protein [Myxococcales bacterium]